MCDLIEFDFGNKVKGFVRVAYVVVLDKMRIYANVVPAKGVLQMAAIHTFNLRTHCRSAERLTQFCARHFAKRGN